MQVCMKLNFQVATTMVQQCAHALQPMWHVVVSVDNSECLIMAWHKLGMLSGQSHSFSHPHTQVHYTHTLVSVHSVKSVENFPKSSSCLLGKYFLSLTGRQSLQSAGEGLCMELMCTLLHWVCLFYCTVTPSLTLVLSHYISTNPDPAVSVQFHNVLLQLLLMLACTDDIMAQQVRITTYGNLEMVN